MELDLGDALLLINLRIKGVRHLRPIWHIGRVTETEPADRVIHGPPYAVPTGKADLIMDLQADKKVALSLGFTDEVGNPVPAPAGAVTVYTVDDPTIISLTDNGDGTAVAAATGTLGIANVHVDVTFDGHTVTGDLQLVVVAGDAERVAIVAGATEEVTPDV